MYRRVDFILDVITQTKLSSVKSSVSFFHYFPILWWKMLPMVKVFDQEATWFSMQLSNGTGGSEIGKQSVQLSKGTRLSIRTEQNTIEVFNSRITFSLQNPYSFNRRCKLQNNAGTL